MIKILFICHGNICRSPMAEFVLKDMVRKVGLAAEFEIASAATSSEELGNPVYPPARRKLAEHGIDCAGKLARKINSSDYEHYDMLIGMDEENIYELRRYYGGDAEKKIYTLLHFAGRDGQEVADPWYTRNFEATWVDVNEGCLGLLNSLFPTVTLDFSACRERGELYSVMRERMLWGKDYGENLDALHDILTGMPHYGKRFNIILPDESAPCRAYAEKVVMIFSSCEPTD